MPDKTIYIAGPMRGYPLFNFPAFDEAEKLLTEIGWNVINPAELDRQTGFDPVNLPEDYDWQCLDSIGFSLKDAIHRDVEAIKQCDAIYMLKGWKKSTGANAELALAKWMGCRVIYEERHPKLFICGHARHGKDTVGEILKERFALKGVSSSLLVASRYVRRYLERNHGLFYTGLKECYEDRINHRSKWYNAIAEYTKDDPSRMARELFEKNQLYIGIRRREEFLASRHLADFSIWVDASKRLPAEDSSSCTVRPEDCDVIIDNNGTVEDLAEKVDRLMSFVMG